MIRTQKEYEQINLKIDLLSSDLEEIRIGLLKENTPEEVIHRATAALRSHQQELIEERDRYDQALQGIFPVINDIRDIGQWLIAIRLAARLNQRELADLLGVSDALVSRDERSEYHNVGVDRIAAICEALGYEITIRAIKKAHDTPEGGA